MYFILFFAKRPKRVALSASPNARKLGSTRKIHTHESGKFDSSQGKASERICDILGGFMPRFQNTITMSQRFWRWYFMIRAKAQCILSLLLLKVLTISSI